MCNNFYRVVVSFNLRKEGREIENNDGDEVKGDIKGVGQRCFLKGKILEIIEKNII